MEKHPFLQRLLLFSVVVLLFYLQGCEEGPVLPTPPPPQDPCEGLSPLAEADFMIYENVGDSLVESTTILAYDAATFKAIGEFDSVKWVIGLMDSVFTAEQFSLRFLDNAIGSIEVSMAGYRTNNGCFPDDTEVIHLNKQFRVIKWGEAPIIGNYEGYFNGGSTKKDTVGVYFQVEPGYPEDYWWGEFDLTNIHPGCNINPFDRGGFIEDPYRSGHYSGSKGSRAFIFKSSSYPNSSYSVGNCRAPNAFVSLLGEDTLKVHYTYFDGVGENASPLYTGEFIGIRINE